MSGAIRVRQLDVMAGAEWRWQNTQPVWQHHQHGRAVTFDPFPAYPHDVIVAEQAAQQVAELVPLAWDIDIVAADREEIGRSNGFSDLDDTSHYNDAGEWVRGDPAGLIVLSGKRVPPHPALTRYLVAHEVGHHVEWMLNRARGAKHPQSGDTINAYAALRGMGSVHHGSGGRWHDSVDEVFACDFRIVVCKTEVEYWPHPGIPHPHDRSLPFDLWSWWADALEDLKNPTTPEE